tara:strand:- start:192 stop:407 length:216 start_codon:yes stop_codon:yes gene_type:complete
MHTVAFFNVLEQTQAVEDIAPAGFKLHHDFNGNRTLATALPPIRRLEAYPVVSFIEDPFPKQEQDAWHPLR